MKKRVSLARAISAKPDILLIDDEADNASVNTKRDEDNPTIINKYISIEKYSFAFSFFPSPFWVACPAWGESLAFSGRFAT